MLEFSQHLYTDGYRHILNVDYSETVIERMRGLTRESCPEMGWECMDMRKLDALPECSVDVVMDKGALDALWADAGSQWDPAETTKANIAASLSETYRYPR